MSIACMGHNYGCDDFATYHLDTTTDGMALLEKLLKGDCDAPWFSIVKVSSTASLERPGNADPGVTECCRSSCT